MDATAQARDDALAALTGGDTLSALAGSSGSALSKKTRRATAIYPNLNKASKPFSRSAAKRESVMALGSIEHLQHYFTKTGMRAKVNPLKPNSGAAPALGPLMMVPTIVTEGDEGPLLPPSPAIPRLMNQAPFVNTYLADLDPQHLRPGVVRDLGAVARTWGIDDSRIAAAAADLPLDGEDKPEPAHRRDSTASSTSCAPGADFDVLHALQTTTRAIRAVRNFALAVPDEHQHLHAGTSRSSSFRPSTLGPRPSIASVPQTAKHLSAGQAHHSLARIRRAALDVLHVLRELEERARVPGTNVDGERAEDALSDHSAGSRSHTPAMSTSASSDEPPARAVAFAGVQVWSDDEDAPDEDALPKREPWDERLVLGGGWLYRTDLPRAELARERDVVVRWLTIAEEIVLATPAPRRRASSSNSEPASPSHRRTSAYGVLTEEPNDYAIAEEDDGATGEVDDAALPIWARRSAFPGDPLGRAHALLAALLPPALLPLLPLDPGPGALISALASGQLLCTAYNAGVRRSAKPWGFISADAIWDVAGASTGEKWTFRRTENLRLWAAALKLRYLVPLVAPAAGAASVPDGPLAFDARVVARREDGSGWEAMLEAAVALWVDAVVHERRAQA